MTNPSGWFPFTTTTALVPVRLGWVGEDYELPGWSYALAAVALAAAFAGTFGKTMAPA